MFKKRICLLALVMTSVCLLISCKKETKLARKPYIMYEGNLYGISAEPPKSYSYEELKDKITHEGKIESLVDVSKLPEKDFEANKPNYKDAKLYTHNEDDDKIYLRFDEEKEDDRLIRFDKD